MAAAPSIGRATEVERKNAPATDAAGSLYQQYHRPIYGYCVNRLRSREEAEDAMQTTFLRAFDALQRGVEPDVEAAWLFKIAHNVCLSRRLSATRRGRVEAPRDLHALQDELAAPQRSRDELIPLDDVLAEMPERLRTAFLLREWQGLSYQEIADHLEISHSAVETLIFRARRHLAQALHAPKRSYRRVRHALEGLGLVPALKGVLGGGTAKIAAVATATGVAATIVAAVPQESRDAAPPARGAAPSVAGTKLPPLDAASAWRSQPPLQRLLGDAPVSERAAAASGARPSAVASPSAAGSALARGRLFEAEGHVPAAAGGGAGGHTLGGDDEGLGGGADGSSGSGSGASGSGSATRVQRPSVRSAVRTVSAPALAPAAPGTPTVDGPTVAAPAAPSVSAPDGSLPSAGTVAAPQVAPADASVTAPASAAVAPPQLP